MSTSVSFTESRFGLDSSDGKDAYADCLVILTFLRTCEYHLFLVIFLRDAWNLY